MQNMNKPNNVFYEKPNMQNRSTQAKTYYASSNNKMNKPVTSLKNLVANVVIVALSVFFVLLFFIAIAEIKDVDYAWTRDEDDFWYYISDGQYQELTEAVYHNQNEGVRETEGLKQCYAVAEYFEAASFYKVAIYVNDKEDMVKYKDIMEECLTNMDDIAYIAEEINQKLGLDE